MSARKPTHCSIVFLQTILAAGAFALAACGPAEAPAPKPPTVGVAKPIRKTVTDWDEFTGHFEATEQVDIRARVSGYLETVASKDGAIIQKGDLLFIIDPRPYEAALKRSQAALASAQARVTQSGRDLHPVAGAAESRQCLAGATKRTHRIDRLLRPGRELDRSPPALAI